MCVGGGGHLFALKTLLLVFPWPNELHFFCLIYHILCDMNFFKVLQIMT